jgi:hypothetical protein
MIETLAWLRADGFGLSLLEGYTCITRALGYGVIRRDTRRRYPWMDEGANWSSICTETAIP